MTLINKEDAITQNETEIREFAIDYLIKYQWAVAESATAKDIGGDKVELTVIFKRKKVIEKKEAQGPDGV